MRKPPALRSGGRIAVVAPASPFRREEFESGIEEIGRLGFEPVYDDTVFAREGYVAGPAEVRAAAIRRAWADPSIGAVIGVRGGYGSAQLLPLLDVDEMRRTPKPLIGYSDLTSLLSFLTVQCGIVAFHGPMLAGRLAKGEAGYDRRSLLACVSEPAAAGELTAEGLESVRPGEAIGPLVGGTMTQLLASLATPFAFLPPKGCVLFLEEVGERPYRLDRMMWQLRQSGLLARAAAVVVGELPGCDEPGGTPGGRATMAALLADFPGPVVLGFPSGHTTGAALTIPLGVACRVIAGPRPRLVIEESAVV